MTPKIKFPTIGISAAEANMLYHLRRMEALFNKAAAPWSLLEELEFHVRTALDPYQAESERAPQEAARAVQDAAKPETVR
jgi:hypothetical protein